MTAVRSVMALPIDSIAIPDTRIGYFDAAHAERLGKDIVASGQHDPIHVKRNGNAGKLPWTLIAGMHRLSGAKGEGLAQIDAIQVADATTSTDELRRLELSENLDHRKPRPIERAIFMVARARIEEALDHPGRVGESPQARAGRARHSASDIVSDADGWRQRTADTMGCTIRTLGRYERIHSEIVVAMPDHAEALNFHPLGESLSAMTRLAAQNEVARIKVANLILSKPDWQSMDEVMKQDGMSVSTGTRYHHTERMKAAWVQMELFEKRECVAWLVDNVTAGMAADMVAGFKAKGLLA